MQVWHCCRIVVCCFFFLRSVFLWEIHFDLPSFFPSFWNSEKLPSNKFSLSLSLSFVMPLSRQTLTERSTMTEPPWLCIEACNVCGLGESVRIHTDNRVKKQLVVLFCWFVRFPNLWWVEWVGPEGCWNLPRLGFFLGCLDRTALRTFASPLLAPSLAGWLATPPLPHERLLAGRLLPLSAAVMTKPDQLAPNYRIWTPALPMHSEWVPMIKRSRRDFFIDL